MSSVMMAASSSSGAVHHHHHHSHPASSSLPPRTSAAASVKPPSSAASSLPPVRSGFQRFVLEAEQELRIEANTVSSSTAGTSSSSTAGGGGGAAQSGERAGASRSSRGESGSSRSVTIILQAGSGEIFGHELAHHRSYHFTANAGGLSFPIFTFHGCVVDVGHENGSENGGEGSETRGGDDSSSTWSSHNGIHGYVATDRDDTAPNLACVNTHAQLEALRDEALAATTVNTAAAAAAAVPSPTNATSTTTALVGPRVLVLGGSHSGTSSLVKTLVSYAIKLGRTPLWVDLDPGDSGMGLPGTIGVVVANRDSITLSTLLHGGGGMPVGTASPLALFHGSVVPQRDLMRAQVSSLARKIFKRMDAIDNDWERSSGVLINAPSWLALDENWDVLVHTLVELKISVVLLTGHDKLYAKLKSIQQPSASTSAPGDDAADTAGWDKNAVIVKLPRSGGVVSRNSQQMRQLRSQCIRRYFYGDDLQETSSGGGGASAAAASAKGETNPAPGTGQPQPSLTPFLAQIKFDQVRLYRCTSMSLSSSLLPLGATQTTEKVQLQPVTINEQVTHHLLAVCHPHSVALYDQSGSAQDLYGAGVAGFVVVERVLMETEMLHLLAPCAGALPSHTLLIGDITWLD